MKLDARKVTFVAFFDEYDDQGHQVGEPVCGSRRTPEGEQLLVLYPHEFGPALTKKIEALKPEVEASLRASRSPVPATPPAQPRPRKRNTPKR